MPLLNKLGLLAMLAVFTLAGVARAETVELVTYYPSSATTGQVDTDRLRASRGTVGNTYSMTNPADAALPDGMLLVADRVGIGPNFAIPPPLTERLEVEGNILATSSSISALFKANRRDDTLPNGLQLLTNRVSKWTLGSPAGTENLQVQGTADVVSNAVFMPGADNVGVAGVPEIRVGIGTNTPAGPLHVQGVADAVSKVLFMPGANTAAAGTPEIRVGIGTNAPQELAHVAGNLRVDGMLIVDGTFNGTNGVFVDNFLNHIRFPDMFRIDAISSFEDVPHSRKTVTIPSGKAMMVWTLSGYTDQGGAGVWDIRPVIGTAVGPEVSVGTNEVGSHKYFSGSWATPVTGGTVIIKLQVRRVPGTNFGPFVAQNDVANWSLIIFRD